MKFTKIGILMAAAVSFCGSIPATAQEYPSRPLRAITTMSAGGLSDIFIRAVGQELQKRWGQPLIVENRPGGMHNIGARAYQDALPDGYTHLHHLFESVVSIRAFQEAAVRGRQLNPVTNSVRLFQLPAINAETNAWTIDDSVALSKANRQIATPATHTVASVQDRLKTENGADCVRVPFKGGAMQVESSLGGRSAIRNSRRR